MNIHWTKDHPEANYSSMTGTDENGNIFFMSANGEVVSVETLDGRDGIGWTAEEALRNAEAKPVDLLAALEIARRKIEKLIPAATGGLPATGDSDYKLIRAAIAGAKSHQVGVTHEA